MGQNWSQSRCFCSYYAMWARLRTKLLEFVTTMPDEVNSIFWLIKTAIYFIFYYIILWSRPWHHPAFACYNFFVFNLKTVSHQNKINLLKSLYLLNAYSEDFLLVHMSLLIGGNCYYSSCFSKSRSHHPSIYWCIKSQTVLLSYMRRISFAVKTKRLCFLHNYS